MRCGTELPGVSGSHTRAQRDEFWLPKGTSLRRFQAEEVHDTTFVFDCDNSLRDKVVTARPPTIEQEVPVDGGWAGIPGVPGHSEPRSSAIHCASWGLVVCPPLCAEGPRDTWKPEPSREDAQERAAGRCARL